MNRVRPNMVIAAALVAPICLPAIAFGQSETSFSADASANVGYSSNPFSDVGNDTGSGIAQIRVDPRFKLSMERSVLVLSGNVDYQKYFRRYNDSADFGVQFDYSAQASERLKTHLNLRYDNAIVGRNQVFAGPVDPNAVVEPVTSGTDIALFGTRDRRRTFRANGDINYSLSSRDSLAASTYYVRSRYAQFGAQGNYDGYGGSAGYNRAVSAHLQLGAQASVARYHYLGGSTDTTVFTGQGVFVAVLSPAWTASGAVGVSFTTGRTNGTTATFSGNLRLCRSTTRSSLCLSANRAVLPTGITGTQNETTIGADYSYRLTSHSKIFANVNYSKNGLSQLLLTNQNEYFRSSAGYEKQVSERIRLVASGHYARIYGGTINRQSDVGGLLGVAIKFGALQ